MMSDISRVDENNYAESGNRFDLDSSGIQQFEPDKITDVEAVDVIGGGGGNENAADSSAIIGERPQMAGESSMELVKRTESGAGEVAGTGTGTRTRKVMIKTVRMVKKVIKKRVPKRVLINGVEVRREATKVKDGMNSSEVRIDANLASNATEKSNFSDGLMEKTCEVNKAEDTINTVDEFAGKENLVNDVVMGEEEPSIVHHLLKEEDIRDESIPENVEAPNVSAPAICDDVSAHIESEMSEPVNSANLSEQIVSRNDESSIYCMDADNIKGNDAVIDVEMNNSTKCSRDLEVDKANFTQGTNTERENIWMENQLEDCLMQNHKIDIVYQMEMEMKLLTGENAGPIGAENEVLCSNENEMSIVKAESCRGEVESDHTRLNEGLILSGEMEALERRRNRRTEIFIGGLSKDTKEEDIREAFGDVGSLVEVRVVVNPKTRKNRGFAFVQFATAADAKNALVKYPEVKIRGNLCNAAAVEGNDTIFLGNLDRNWKTEDIEKLLQEAGIEKIDKVTLKVDPKNTERNRGFAFVELQTCRDAQAAFKKLQKKDVFGKNQMVKVAWAEPLNEPAEEEISQVKSVYAEFLPSSWDEEKVKEYFKRFGDIESVVLAKDLLSSRRKDFAFINFTTRDAALTCIEAVNREKLGDHCPEVKMAVSLAKPIPERKQMGHTFNPTNKQHVAAKENTLQTSKKVHGTKKRGKAASSSNDHAKVVNRPSTTTTTTEELMQILRQQALTKHNIPSHRRTGVTMPDHSSPVPGSKRPFRQVGYDPLYMESQGPSRVRVESSYQFSGESSLPSHLVLPPYHHQPRPGNPSESINGRRNYLNPFQTRNGASSYYKDTNPYHRY